VLNVLLQLLDDGRLTDAQGRTVDFRNTIVIMTSNLGSQWITERGLSEDEIRERVMDAVRTHFRPELLNRIDEIVIFHALGLEQIQRIVEIQLRGLRKRLEERKMSLDLTPAAAQEIARAGFDPVYGARPLKRTIQKDLVQPLAVRMLQGQFVDGDHIVVDQGAEGSLTFSKAPAPVPAPA
jgi:ATP-dependent Clp protease ATP-binding subunit ClpB